VKKEGRGRSLADVKKGGVSDCERAGKKTSVEKGKGPEARKRRGMLGKEGTRACRPKKRAQHKKGGSYGRRQAGASSALFRARKLSGTSTTPEREITEDTGKKINRNLREDGKGGRKWRTLQGLRPVHTNH